MFTCYLILTCVAVSAVRAQYLLAEYAPGHDNYQPANYHFSYGVSDPTTGDHKHHWEKRLGDHVIGEYGLLEPDGATRIVKYTADPHNGFQAVVTRIENNVHYSQGHALYGGRHRGLYNAAETQRAPEQYYPNQYAGSYNTDDKPDYQEVRVRVEKPEPVSEPVQQLADHNIPDQYNFGQETVVQSTPKGFSLHEQPEQPSSVDRHELYNAYADVQPQVEVFPNGQNVATVTAAPERVQVTPNLAVNPILTNLMNYIREHMPPRFRQQVVSSTTTAPEVGPQVYTHNPYLNGEIKAQDLYSDNANDYDEKKIYYELDPAGYQGNARQQDAETIYKVTNENGYNLQTPNFYQPTDPNQYNDAPRRDTTDNLPAGNDFIWNAGDPTQPVDPETLVRHLNETCAYFRFNETNDYEERDQQPHIWNSGDYTALRTDEELIRSLNVTCDNFTNDILNNFTSGFNLAQYCSHCLSRSDDDVSVVNRELSYDQNGRPVEVYYSATQPKNLGVNYNADIKYNPNRNEIYTTNYEDGRTNAEIAGIVQVYKQQNIEASPYAVQPTSGSNQYQYIPSVSSAQNEQVDPKQYLQLNSPNRFDVSNAGPYKYIPSISQNADQSNHATYQFIQTNSPNRVLDQSNAGHPALVQYVDQSNAGAAAQPQYADQSNAGYSAQAQYAVQSNAQPNQYVQSDAPQQYVDQSNARPNQYVQSDAPQQYFDQSNGYLADRQPGINLSDLTKLIASLREERNKNKNVQNDYRSEDSPNIKYSDLFKRSSQIKTN